MTGRAVEEVWVAVDKTDGSTSLVLASKDHELPRWALDSTRVTQTCFRIHVHGIAARNPERDARSVCPERLPCGALGGPLNLWGGLSA
jgi:hypothetical protein